MEITKFSIAYMEKNNNTPMWRAFIHLTGSGNKYIGGIYFYDDEVATGRNDGYSNEYLFMSLPTTHLPRIIDALRSERSVYFTYNNSRGKSYISTSVDFTGEKEWV